MPPGGAHHPAGRRARRAALVDAETDDELVEAVRGRRRRAASRVLVLGGGSNLVVADEGFDGTVAAGRDPRGGRRATPGDALVEVARRRGLGRRWSRWPVDEGWAGRRGAVRHPRPGRRDADPERRRLRPGGRRRPSPRCASWTGDHGVTRPSPPPTAASATATSRFKRDPGRYVVLDVDLPARALGELAAPVRVRRAGPRASASRSATRAPLADVREAVLDLRRAQGHGARPRRPRHVERRVVLHQPGRSTPAAPTGCRPTAPALARSPTAGSRRSAAWLIEQAGFAQGLRHRRGAARLDQAHPGADQPRRRDDRRTCWPWPARSATASADAFGVDLVNEPVLVGVARPWAGPAATAGIGRPARRRCRPAAGPRTCVRGAASRAPSSGPARPAPRRRSRGRRARSRTARPAASRTAAGRRRPSATGTPASSSARSGTSAAVGVDARARTLDTGQTSQRHPGCGEPLEQRRVLGRADAVADPVARRGRPGRPRTLLGPGELAAVRHRQQPGAVGDRGTPGRSPRSRPRRSSLDRPKPTTPAAGVLRREPGQRAGVQRVPGAVGGDDHPDADAGGRGRLGARRRGPARSQAVSPPSRGAYDVGSTWISSQPEPSRGVVLGRLAHQPADVGLAAHDRARRRRRAAGSGTSRARRWPAAPAARPTAQRRRAAGCRCSAASSRRVAGRSDPVKCRCRCAFGSVRRSRPVLTPPEASGLPSEPRHVRRRVWCRSERLRRRGRLASPSAT